MEERLRFNSSFLNGCIINSQQNKCYPELSNKTAFLFHSSFWLKSSSSFVTREEWRTFFFFFLWKKDKWSKWNNRRQIYSKWLLVIAEDFNIFNTRNFSLDLLIFEAMTEKWSGGCAMSGLSRHSTSENWHSVGKDK